MTMTTFKIAISRRELFAEIENICGLLARSSETDMERKAAVADVLDGGNIELVNRAIGEGFDEVTALLDTFFGSESATDIVDSGDGDTYQLVFDADDSRWRASAIRRFERWLFAYLRECAVCRWLALTCRGDLALHEAMRSEALASLRMTVIQRCGARIVPRP